jgi:Microcystin-dependent protein
MSLLQFRAAIAALLPSKKIGGLSAADHRSVNDALITKMYLPEGLGFPYWGSTTPEGFHFFDGGELSRTGCPLLFALWGTKYGAGDGSTTFNCPVMDQGSSPVQAGTKVALGVKGGSMDHTPTADEIPEHFHKTVVNKEGKSGGGILANDPNFIIAIQATGDVSGDDNNAYKLYGNWGDPTHGKTSSVGSGKMFSIMNPYMGVNWIFRLE